MRTSEERTKAMHMRAAEIRREKRSRMVIALEACASAVCIAAVIILGIFMPRITSNMDIAENPGNMHASIFAGSPALGYIVIAIVAFALGIIVTVFCLRLKKWQDDKDKEDNSKQ